MSPLDRPLSVTLFADHRALHAESVTRSLRELAPAIQRKTATSKSELPWLKLAAFSNNRTPRGSLRNAANMLTIGGVEGDHDLRSMTPDGAVTRLRNAGIAGMVYTSPSHATDQPKWRVLCPVSRPLPVSERRELVGRLNHVLGGVLASESFRDSQAFYWGSVNDNPDHAVHLVDGDYLDTMPDPPAPLYPVSPKVSIPKLPPSAGPDDAARAALNAATALFSDSVVVSAGRHYAILAATAAIAPFVLSGHLDRSAVILAIEDACDQSGRTPDDLETEQALTGALRTARPYEPPTGGAEFTFEPPATFRSGNHSFPLTQDGVAQAFVRQHRDTLRFCPDTGRWYYWNGAVWRDDNTRLAFEWARVLSRSLAEQPSTPESVRREFSKVTHATAVETYARSDREMVISAGDFDRNPMMLGTPGGTVDLQTGELLSARADDAITMATAVTPSDDPDCPNWLAFLNDATGGDAELATFLQQFAGYTLTGDTREHALLFVYGPGGNGKSVFLNTLTGILGGYARTAAMDTLTDSTGDRHPTDMAMLRGARLVSASETEEGRPWAESKIKSLTGGDPITARFMRQDFFTYQPAFKLVVIGNHKPILRNPDAAARRRFNIVPFIQQPATPDRSLEHKLRAEWPGILRWMIDGCLSWQAHGLQQPEIVRAATDEYFSEQDSVARWLEECCERGGRALSASSADLFESWRRHAVTMGEHPHTSKWLAQALERHGCEPVRRVPGPRNGRGFLKVRVRPSDDLTAILA